MLDDVHKAITAGIVQRREILRDLSLHQRERLLEELFIDVFARQHIMLQKWAALTGQSAQVDTGYMAQFIASLVLGEPGQGFRGKGDDLADGSEVKSAANISGVDRPRWNHNMGTHAQDQARLNKGQTPMSDEYLNAPHLFYLLVDRVATEHGSASTIRVRAWCVDAQLDEAWRSLLIEYRDKRTSAQYNLQLHPPVGYDDDIVVNTLGNLDMSETLLFDARLSSIAQNPRVRWVRPLREPILPIQGRCKSIPYGGRTSRPSRLTTAEDLIADIAVLPSLFPDILNPTTEQTLEEVSAREAEAESEN